MTSLTASLQRIGLGAAPLLTAAVLQGCTGSDVPPDSGAAAAAGARVPVAPTAAGELPPTLRGEGGALLGSDVHYIAEDDETTGYLAVPEGAGPFPALVLVHEWNGLVDDVRQIADDLAAEGYVVLAADLFRGRTGTNPDENMALVREAQAEPVAIVANLDAAVAFLRDRPDVTGRVGAMGWCFGGGVALSYGLDGAGHEATAIFYGRLVDDPAVLAELDHEVYGTFAELDEGIPRDAVEGFVAALREAGVENDVHVYGGVDHGFWLHADEDPATRAEPALDAWERLKAYLGRTLGGEPGGSG